MEFLYDLGLCILFTLPIVSSWGVVYALVYLNSDSKHKTVGKVVDMFDKPATVFIWTVSSMYVDEDISDDDFDNLCVFGGSSSKIPYDLRRCPVECIRCEGDLYLYVHDRYLKHISL